MLPVFSMCMFDLTYWLICIFNLSGNLCEAWLMSIDLGLSMHYVVTELQKYLSHISHTSPPYVMLGLRWCNCEIQSTCVALPICLPKKSIRTCFAVDEIWHVRLSTEGSRECCCYLQHWTFLQLIFHCHSSCQVK
jgi:hypothetical protein